MSIHLDDVTAATTLLAFALRPRRIANAHDTYAELRDRYRNDPAFARIVDAAAAGLELRTIGTSPFGLVITPEPGSVFAARTGDYHDVGTSVEHRLLHGLAHLGIAAYCYPTPAALGDPRTVRIAPAKVETETTEAAQRLAADAPDDAAVDSDELRDAWREWLALPPDHRTPTGRLAKHSSRAFYIETALRWLTDQGMLTYDGTQWRTTEAYRMHVHDIANDVRFTLVRSYVRDGDTPGPDTAEPADPEHAATAHSDSDDATDRRETGAPVAADPTGA